MPAYTAGFNFVGLFYLILLSSKMFGKSHLIKMSVKVVKFGRTFDNG